MSRRLALAALAAAALPLSGAAAPAAHAADPLTGRLLVTLSTPSSSETNSSICSDTCGPIGQPGLVSVKVTCTSPASTSTP